MTNTGDTQITLPTTDAPTEGMSKAQFDAYRADEAGFLRDLRAHAARHGVLRVGRFLPGAKGMYSAAYVLREVGSEYVTAIAVRVDDNPMGVSFYFSSGHYFPDFGRANLDLENRY